MGLVGVAAVLVWLLARGYADYLARPAPERALALNGDQPEALVRLADRALVAGGIDIAEVAANRVLATHPFEGRALRILGAIAERRGERTRAFALMRLAAATTPRESAAQFWLAVNALADKDLDDALRRLDRLLRFEPETLADVFPILAVIAVNPAGAAQLAGYLAADAPWRPEFMRMLIGGPESSIAIRRLFRAIEAAGGAVSDIEQEQLANRLLAQRDWDRLRRLIAATAPDPAGTHLRDGGFDGVGRGPLTGWAVAKVPGADVVMAAPDIGGNRALRVVFYDRRVPFRHVNQVLLLQPGRYRLSGRARLLDLRAALGLGWNLSCVESGASLGKSERMLGNRDWRGFSFDFEVPAVDCGAQALQLVLDARIAAEQQVAGEAWFDDLQIQSIESPAVVPADARGGEKET